MRLSIGESRLMINKTTILYIALSGCRHPAQSSQGLGSLSHTSCPKHAQPPAFALVSCQVLFGSPTCGMTLIAKHSTSGNADGGLTTNARCRGGS